MPTENLHFAIIGAGLSGAFLAHQLTSVGHTVSVFEKSRGTGGRLSSCRMGELSADLGAPFFDCARPEFQAWLNQQPHVAHWSPKTCDFSLTALPTPTHSVMCSRQSQLTRSLLQGSTLVTSTRVGYIWPEIEHDKQTVLLRDEQGQALGTFDAAIVATPAQQAAPLLEALPRFSNKALETEFSISWVLVLEFEQPISNIDAELIQGEHPIFARCIKDSAKPNRHTDSSIWVLEANSHWSDQHQDQPKEWVTKTLINAFKTLCNGLPAIRSQRVHRWLYARHPVANTSSHGFLWDEQTRIGACGDWLMQGDLESAWISANNLFNAIETRHHLPRSA